MISRVKMEAMIAMPHLVIHEGIAPIISWTGSLWNSVLFDIITLSDILF
jgi:hypothetical protein